MSGVWDVPEDLSFDNDLWLTLETLQQQMQDLENEEFEVSVSLPDNKPILVAWLSDSHLGHTEADMSLLRRDLDIIRQTEGVYVILGGDLFDNVVTSVATRGMHHQQLTPVRIQRYLVDQMVEYLGKDKVLAMLLGNHDEWSMSSIDYDPTGELARKLGCPYLGPQGFVNLSLGSEQYRILCAHQFRMRSSFNRTHQGKRLEDFLGDADIVFTGHTHEAAAESTDRRGQKKFYGQAGSYVKSTRYGKRLGFPGTTAAMPGAIVWGDRKKVLGMEDAFEDGVAMLRAFRA